MSVYTRLGQLKKKIIAGQLPLTDDVVAELMLLEAEITEGKEADGGSEAYFDDPLMYVSSSARLKI